MFPSFIGILDIQSWWEVPSIAYFCSLFRTAFNLLDFDIEELEEALLTDGTEESASSLLTELIVRLLNGCLGNNDISAFNFQMYLRRLFRRKCQETRRYNPFDSDIDFQFLPLRTKVEILYALCDFRLDADDVFDLFKNLEAESLRVEPLGWDDNDSAYWYFYGTRLYREDIIRKPKGKNKKKKGSKKRGWFYGDDWLDDNETERVWQVVCFTQEDWTHLTEKFSKATSKVEKELYRSLSQNFLPEIPRLFQEKERLQRKRLLELAPRRTSSRVLQKIKQKEEEGKSQSSNDTKENRKEILDLARENRAKRRNSIRRKSASSDSSEESSKSEKSEMFQTHERYQGQEKRLKSSPVLQKGELQPKPPIKTGRKTNNSLASATGQILIPDSDEPVNSTRKKLKTSQIFSQSEEDIQTDMYKVLEQLTAHEDAWPFLDPVEEEYAPNYYAVIRRPMDLHKMEERLDSGYYTDFAMFKADFKLIVNNCRLYNGQDNEYTIMVDNLQAAFDRLTEKYIHRLSSSDEEIAVEYQMPTPSRKHKLKPAPESPNRHKRKKRKSPFEAGEAKSTSDPEQDQKEVPGEEPSDTELKLSKESQKQGKGKKKRKSHHRHGKHSKNRRNRKDSHKLKHGNGKKHGKKQKHGKNKEGKKSKQKKKKIIPVEPEPSASLERVPSQESLESSNRSRSASPLPSIHTSSPSSSPGHEYPPSNPPDSPLKPDFFKDKYDKIKERRRHAVKDAWESLFDYKQKSVDKQKQNLNIPEKDKNQKLRETIEKLRAQKEKYKDVSLLNSLFPGSRGSTDLNSDGDTKESSNKKNDLDLSDVERAENQKGKTGKKGQKKNTAKNESASEALEQAVKDISKWLDETPKRSTGSSPCESPAQTISTEEQDNSRFDDELSQGEKSMYTRKEVSRKRPSSREPKLFKRREIQRTIDRLQPGKSKGNLLTNISNKSTEKTEEVAPAGPLTKSRDSSKGEESSPKLSLGSVLPTVDFSLDKDHNFIQENKIEAQKEAEPKVVAEEETKKKEEETMTEKKPVPLIKQPDKKDVEIETDPITPIKPSQEKATPNLSAWFKAFGAPKSTTTMPAPKKKEETSEEKPSENVNNETKSLSPKNTAKFDSPTDLDARNPDGGDSPLLNVGSTPRQRRTSTGSSVSERSSFSQDLDSPRQQMAHTSPLLRSPASPRDDFQKIIYPIINGTVRAGFYQDTTSIKSSPEKSCSPREAPQSPYSPYSQHVYASNSAMGSSTPTYFGDHNKSPLPTYGQNPPPYYDTAKGSSVSKPARPSEDYTSVAPNSYQQSQYLGPYSPAQSPYTQVQASNYSQARQSPQPVAAEHPPTTASNLPPPPTTEQKNTLFPVKKRTYNEPESVPSKKDSKETTTTLPPNKLPQSLHNISSLSTHSVDDIALALSEKSEFAKLNNSKKAEYDDPHVTENRTSHIFDKDNIFDVKKEFIADKATAMSKKDNVDMVNMGYMNPENDHRNTSEAHDVDFSHSRDIQKLNTSAHDPKGYEVDAIAINLGLSVNSQMQNSLSKCISSNIPPAHMHELTHNESMNMSYGHHNQHEVMSVGQSISNFSLNDIELANKKLFACNSSASPATLDYGNWKINAQTRKQDMLPSDYSNVYAAHSDKLKNEISTSNSGAINYNKNIQHQQYNSYNIPRTATQDLQQNLPSELRIPNPRGLLKSDVSVAASISDTQLIAKSLDNLAKVQKTEKLAQNHPLISPYKTPYSTHSSIPLESLRNLPNIPQMLEHYTNDERYLSSFGSNPALYHDKTLQMAQMLNKSMASSTSVSSIYSQPSSIYKTSSSVPTITVDAKVKTKRKRTSDSKSISMAGSQNYHSPPCTTDVLTSVKTSMMQGSAFFGSSTNMALSSGLYADNAGFSIEDFRNSTNQLMAANYMAAAVAHQQRSNAEANSEKLVKPAHQNSSHTSSSFPFIGHSQVRAGYPYVSAESSSPLYQQYLQRHQEELLRQTGAQIMGLYPPGYPATLGVRQPYDSINRPSWL